jgi:hypothetical protein
VLELFLVDGKNLLQLTNFGRNDTGVGLSFLDRGRALFVASANPSPPDANPGGICQLFSVSELGGGLRQITHLPGDRPSDTCYAGFDGPCTIQWPTTVAADRITGTVVFASSCDPVGGNPFGDQIFAIAPDGTGLRQLTATRGMTTDPDGTVRVEMPGPFAYPSSLR